MPPKGYRKNPVAQDGDTTPSLAQQVSYLHNPRPFKNPNYSKNVNRRAKNIKSVMAHERERERLEREAKRAEQEAQMDTGETIAKEEDIPSYTSIEAAPSLLPPRHYCDITGLEAPYTDPATGLRFHDKSVYELIKSLPASASREYLSARGVNPIVK